MAPAAGVKRSVSFDLLRDVADDEDFAVPPRNDLVKEKIASRRRRRSKSKGKLLKHSFSLSPDSRANLDAAVIALNLPTTENGESHLANGLHSPRKDDLPGESIEDAASVVEDSGSSEVVDSPLLRHRNIDNNDAEAEISSILPGEIESVATIRAFPDPSRAENGCKQVITPECSVEVNSTKLVWDELKDVLWDELKDGTALEITTRSGSEQTRERVYNVLFNVPWRCELLIDVGFFVCLDSFLSLLTVVPLRLLMSLLNCLRNLRNLRANDWCDLGCLVMLLAGVKALQQADISYIYHSIRFEQNIKLYVIYNMLEVFDRLFQSFGVDVLEVVFNSATSYTTEHTTAEFLRLLFDQLIAIGCFIVHSFIILFEAICVAAAIQHAQTNRALLILLMSNNFAEIKSNVFKRFNRENMHSLAHNDTVERFHIVTCLLFVFLQNIIIKEEPWISSFFQHAAMVMICESSVDLIKHAFLAKFNQVEPAAYSDFLRTLCQQVVKNRRKDAGKSLHFVPLGPACVLIKVLIPVYRNLVSKQSAWKAWFDGTVIASATIAVLVASKIVVGIFLQRYATWYLDREKKQHAD